MSCNRFINDILNGRYAESAKFGRKPNYLNETKEKKITESKKYPRKQQIKFEII